MAETLVKNVNLQHKESLSPLERFAVWITDNVGSMGFFFIIFLWTVFWLLWNVLAPSGLRFDVVPAFVVWLFISNILQLFLLPLIMVGQNLQGRHAELRAESDYEVNLKAEKEINEILSELKKQNERISEILERL